MCTAFFSTIPSSWLWRSLVWEPVWFSECFISVGDTEEEEDSSANRHSKYEREPWRPPTLPQPGQKYKKPSSAPNKSQPLVVKPAEVEKKPKKVIRTSFEQYIDAFKSYSKVRSARLFPSMLPELHSSLQPPSLRLHWALKSKSSPRPRSSQRFAFLHFTHRYIIIIISLDLHLVQRPDPRQSRPVGSRTANVRLILSSHGIQAGACQATLHRLCLLFASCCAF
jgi:hypothetical protein